MKTLRPMILADADGNLYKIATDFVAPDPQPSVTMQLQNYIHDMQIGDAAPQMTLETHLRQPAIFEPQAMAPATSHRA